MGSHVDDTPRSGPELELLVAVGKVDVGDGRKLGRAMIGSICLTAVKEALRK